MDSTRAQFEVVVGDEPEDVFKKLFETENVAALPIHVYLEWASSTPGTHSRDLAMPPIQRGFVWKAKQIQELWDSLLRGMPIGAVMVKEFESGQLSGGVASDRTFSPSLQAGFHLIDGQQRTLSMLLGFPQETPTDHKLWVDFSAPGTVGLEFRLRVSTRAQPFGFQLDGRRLSTAERDKAYRTWEAANKGVSFERIFDSGKPWKANSANQGSLFEIKELWRAFNSTNQDIGIWAAQVEDKIAQGSGDVSPELKQRVFRFGKALLRLQNQSLALIKIPHVEVESDPDRDVAGGEDYLTMLFARISSGGTRLSPEDLLFSMIKHRWPEAHRLVYEIQKKVGAMMKPTDFVMTAYRMAALFSSETIADDSRPTAASFHKHLARLQAETSPQSLYNLVLEGLLARHFEQLRECLLHKGKGDHGLPEAMFPYLDVPLLQVLIYWLIKSKTGRFMELERQNVVRFVLYWQVCCSDAASRQEASKKAIAFLASHKDAELFPAIDLYRLLSQAKEGLPSLFCEMVAPPEGLESSVRLLHPDERAVVYFGSADTLYKRFCGKRHLLIWFQRSWMTDQCRRDGEFPWFNPLAGQDEDNVPYDYDHLVPQSNWADLRSINCHDDQKDNYKTFTTLHSRRALGNSIGNYRVFSASGNRSRGDKPLEALFIEDSPILNWEGFAFEDSETNRKLWSKASPVKDSVTWSNDRMMAFQKGVEDRVLYLYRRLYQEAGFSAWQLAPPSVSPADSAAFKTMI